MVTIEKENNHYHFRVKGLHKLWSFRSELSIPGEHIRRAYRPDVAEITGWKGIRLPGTHIPYVLTAGTFYQDGQKVFWDVANKENAIVVELDGESFNQLIIEVEDPEAAVALLCANPV